MGGICIGVVAVDRPAWSFVDSLIRLEKPRQWTWRRVGPLAVDVARNRLVREFLKGTDDWLLMVDADAILHPKTLARLLSWERPLVSVLAFARYGPMFPTVYRGQPEDPEKRGFVIQLEETRAWLQAHPELITSEPTVLEPRPEDALVEVDRTGCHCVLAHRDVFEAIQAYDPGPWFKAREDYENGAAEDFYFFARAQAAGFAPCVDRSCMAGHVYGERTLAARDWLVWDYASDFGQEG